MSDVHILNLVSWVKRYSSSSVFLSAIYYFTNFNVTYITRHYYEAYFISFLANNGIYFYSLNSKKISLSVAIIFFGICLISDFRKVIYCRMNFVTFAAFNIVYYFVANTGILLSS